MKTIKFLSLAALVVMGAILAGCAKDKDVDSVAEDNIVVCTTTVTLDADDTKALSIEGDKGVKTFAEGERVALRYYNTTTTWSYAFSQALSDTDISADGKTATLTFTLDSPKKNDNIIFCYPAALAKFDNLDNFDYEQIIMQNGTLASLSANLDLATASANLSGTNLPANVTLTNQLAILAITLKNSDGSSDITNTITGLTLSDGTNTYSISRSAAAGPIYIAIKPVNNKNIRITATTSGSTSYTKSLTGKTFAAGNGYNVSWRMESAPMLTLTSPSVGQVIGSDGKNYAYNATRPSGVTAVAMIAYLSGGHGLAIAMADENSGNYITWIPAMAVATAHTPAFSGGTWKIPSRNEWKQMFETSGDKYKYDALNSAISNAGGTPFPQKSYWTSTDGGSNRKYIMTFNDGTYVTDGSYQGIELSTVRARSCLAF